MQYPSQPSILTVNVFLQPTIDVLYMLMNSVRQLKVALMPEAQEGFEDHSVRLVVLQ